MLKSSSSKSKLSSSKNEMDKYEVMKLLGEGSFGRVYQAKVVADSSFVALKVICKSRRSNKEIVSLRKECEIQQHLHHPNIIQMLDSFETPSEIVVITEFANKELNTLLGKEGYLAEERAAPILWDLLSALNYLHSHRVLHRDLKPQNILLDSNNKAKLCDFGFARNMSTGTHVLTSIKGTPLYMAPELIEEQPYDFKADLWSLGCIMYEILMGAPPFCSGSILQLIRLIRHEQIKWPIFVSESCLSFLKGLLQKDPRKRFDWGEILSHNFARGHILVCEDCGSLPLTGRMTDSVLQAKEEQRKGLVDNKEKADKKNNNLNFVVENQPIEVEEWLVFLQKTMEEILGGEMTSLMQPYLTNIIISPLRNSNTNSKIVSHVAKLLSIPLILEGVAKDTKDTVKKVYLEVKLVPNLVYATRQIMSNNETNLSQICEEDFGSLEHIYTLITHLVYVDTEFLVQFCDAIAMLNVSNIQRCLLEVNKSQARITMDVLAVLIQVLRVFPENLELVEKVILNEEEKHINFVELLRYNNPLIQERTCVLFYYLGKYLSLNKIEILWNEDVRETLEALMFDSVESVRNAAERVVEELKCKEFYKHTSV